MINLTANNTAIGTRVVRGRSWGYGNQDVFPGNKGTILKHNSSKTAVVVQWDDASGHPGEKYDYNGAGATELSLVVGIEDPKYPEPSTNLIGKTILIHDNQGCSALQEKEQYVVCGFTLQGELEFMINEQPVLWTCNENYSGHFFEVLESIPHVNIKRVMPQQDVTYDDYDARAMDMLEQQLPRGLYDRLKEKEEMFVTEKPTNRTTFTSISEMEELVKFREKILREGHYGLTGTGKTFKKPTDEQDKPLPF